jgi:hypothetical protein
MRQMMFHIFYRAAERPARHSAKLIGYCGHLSAIAQTSDDQLRIGASRDDVTQLAPEVCARIAIDGNMGHVAEIGAHFL